MRRVQFENITNPDDGTVIYPDDPSFFSRTIVHPQSCSLLVSYYTGTDDSIVSCTNNFSGSVILSFRDFQILFGKSIYCQIKAEYDAGTDENLIWFFDLAQSYPATVDLSSENTSQGLDILVANINIDFTSDDKEKILQNIAL